MSDRSAYLLVFAVWCGALLAVPGPRLAAVCCAVLAVALKRPLLVVALSGVLASFVAAGAAHSVNPVSVASHFSGDGLLLSDPEPVGRGVSFEARLGDIEVEASAWGGAAARMRPRLAGEMVELTGQLEPLPVTAEWAARRGIEGRLLVEAVGSWSHGPPHYRIANAFRRTLVDGAASLGLQQRALFTGFVFGDDRHQDLVTADNFRGVGLTHLLAVSGQNVAFVLALSAPAVNRLGPRGRIVGVAAVLLVFATVTRFEPSVLRATAMAGLAAFGACLGRETSSRRILALAVAALILLDPRLVDSLAFQLSALASAGILFLGAPLAARIPGPRGLANAVAVTLAAQVATAPLLVVVFGGVPVATVPANLLAGPASGPIMVWGLTAGLLAGLVGGQLAVLLHLPTQLLVGWVDHVAAAGSRLPLGEIGVRHILLIGVASATLVALSRFSSAAGERTVLVRSALVGLMIAACLHPAWALWRTPPLLAEIGPHAQLWRSGGSAVLIVGPDARPSTLIRELRRASSPDLDVVVFESAGAQVSRQIDAIGARVEIRRILGPRSAASGLFDAAPANSVLELAGLTVRFDADGDDLSPQIVGSDR